MKQPDSMNFLEHLDELRNRLIICVLTILFFAFVSSFFSDKLFFILTKPLDKVNLIYLSPIEGFLVQLKLYFISSIILSSPIILYEILKFCIPAFTKNEKNILIIYFPISIILFITGVLFTYFIFLPIGIKFLSSFSYLNIKPMFSLEKYTSFVLNIIIVTSIFFEMPVFLLILSKLNIISYKFLRKNRKYAILIAFIVGAILSPPDIVTQFLLAVPLLILYEISILLLFLQKK